MARPRAPVTWLDQKPQSRALKATVVRFGHIILISIFKLTSSFLFLLFGDVIPLSTLVVLSGSVQLTIVLRFTSTRIYSDVKWVSPP